jgi:uroporphyrinogen-III synthase
VVETSHHLPLINRRVIVTRAVEQASSLSEKFRQLGAAVIEIPTIQIGPPLSSEVVGDLEAYDWIFFASGNAVKCFVSQCQPHQPDRWLNWTYKQTSNLSSQWPNHSWPVFPTIPI